MHILHVAISGQTSRIRKKIDFSLSVDDIDLSMPSTDQADGGRARRRPSLTTCYSSLFKFCLVSFNFNLFLFYCYDRKRPAAVRYCGRQPSRPAVPAAVLNARSSRSHHCCRTTGVLGGRTAADGRTVDGLGLSAPTATGEEPLLPPAVSHRQPHP